MKDKLINNGIMLFIHKDGNILNAIHIPLSSIYLSKNKIDGENKLCYTAILNDHYEPVSINKGKEN